VSPILEFDSIVRAYKKGVPVLNGVSFSMAEGEVVVCWAAAAPSLCSSRFPGLGGDGSYVRGVFFYPGAFSQLRGRYFFNAMLLRFSGVLPDSLWMLALMTAALTAGLYWLAEKVWRGNEFGQIEIEVRTLQAQAV
jgi:hypothetical protein